MVDASKIIEELQAIVGVECVQAMTSLDAYRVDDQAPWAVVVPGDIEQVAAVLALAHREELAVVPWGGGGRRWPWATRQNGSISSCRARSSIVSWSMSRRT